MRENIVIVGGGQAGAYAINSIRKINTDCYITLISEETELPYERPPLSKECIKGEKKYQDCIIFDKSYYEKNNINLNLNTIVEDVDVKSSKIKIFQNTDVSFDKLLICTGSNNKKIKIDGLMENDIFQLRNIDECKKIMNKSQAVENILIIGGGFIGLEIASSLSKFKKNISVIEIGKQLMGRVIPKEIADIMLVKHKKNNVNIFVDTQILKILKSGNNYEVRLTNGKIIKSEMIIAGIGVEPQVSLLKETTIRLDNGILTNQFCNTSIENIYAAGDVCNFFHPSYNKYIRLESWQHAQKHGSVAGKNIIGKNISYDEVPWMWSNQYDYNLQLTGITNDYDSIVKRGSNIDEGIIYFYLKNNKIRGACGIGKFGKIGKEIKLAGILSKAKKEINENKLSDVNQKLQKI